MNEIRKSGYWVSSAASPISILPPAVMFPDAVISPVILTALKRQTPFWRLEEFLKDYCFKHVKVGGK